MRLELGPDGKIIGTRRVSPNGQVSGLTEFAGQEVLVILPGTSEYRSAPPWGSPEAVAQQVQEQVRQAYRQYELLRELYATPWDATRSFLQTAFGRSWPDLPAEVDRWVKEQIQNPERGRGSSSGSSPSGDGSPAGPERLRSGRKRSGRTDATT